MKLTKPAIAAATLLLAPTLASAAELEAGPIKIGKHNVFISATDGKKDELVISAVRGAPARAQFDSLVYSRGVNVVIRGNTARITGTLGTKGSINLRMVGAKLVKTPRPPAGCTGRMGRTHAGQLTGRINARFAGLRVNATRVRAQIMTTAKITCPARGDDPAKGDGTGDVSLTEPRLTLTKTLPGNQTLIFTALKRQLQFMRIRDAKEKVAHYTELTSITATGDNLLVVGGGGTQATVNRAGAFMGRGEFTSQYPPAGSAVLGPLAPGLSIRPLGWPLYQLTGDDAVLMNPLG